FDRFPIRYDGLRKYSLF
ncbi:unnamed protein product, partial [Rotaria magnacalcarata]